MFNVRQSRKDKKLVNFTPVATNTNETLFRDNSILGTTGPNFLKSQKDRAEGIKPELIPKDKPKRKHTSPSPQPIKKESKTKGRPVGKRRRLKDYL